MSHKRSASTVSQRPKTRMLKVVLLGDGGVGKSSLMRRFVNGEFDPQSFHTIGVEFLNKDITLQRGETPENYHSGHVRNHSTGGNKMKQNSAPLQEDTFTLQIWDTAGQERFKSLRTPFYRGADCCLLTYSVDDRQSFLNLERWKQEFLNYADVSSGEAESFPFVILCNKVDKIACSVSKTREVSLDEARAWCNNLPHPMPHFETSAKDATNVDAAFKAAVHRVVEVELSRDPLRCALNTDTVKLSGKNPKPSSGACC